MGKRKSDEGILINQLKRQRKQFEKEGKPKEVIEGVDKTIKMLSDPFLGMVEKDEGFEAAMRAYGCFD